MLLPALLETQKIHDYIPPQSAEVISTALNVPLADIYGVIEFYSMLSSHPQAESVIRICTTPSCASQGSGELVAQLCQHLGVEIGESVETGGHSAAARAIYNEEADFATTFYSPYLDNETGEAIDWDPSKPADIPDEFIEDCGLDDAGQLVCGPWQVRDARRNIREEAPDVVQKVRILTTTAEITNDTVSFAPEFPEDVREAIMAALFAFAESDPDGFATALDAYSWTNVLPATDEEYDVIRQAVEAAGFTLDQLVE